MSTEQIDATQDRKDFYKNYKKIEMEWIPSHCIRTYAKTKPGFLTLLLTTMMMTSAVLAEQQDSLATDNDDNSNKPAQYTPQFFKSSEKKRGPSLAELAAANMEIDAKLKKNIHYQNDCNNIPEKISELGNTLPGASERMIRVMSYHKMKIKCTTKENLKDMLFGVEGGYGLYNINEKTLYLPFDNLHLSAINHEFIHADHALSHSDVPNQYKAFPLQSRTKESVDAYEAALNKCIERIEEYSKLREKEQMKIRLTGKEFQQLKTYREATKNCIISRQVEIPAKKDDYDRLTKAGWTPQNPNFKINMGGANMRVINVTRTGKNKVMTVEPATPEDSLIFSVFEMKASNFKEAYRQLALKQGKTSLLDQKISFVTELDTRLREAMSQNAENLFLKEANDFITEDKAQYQASDENQYKRRLDL